MPELPEVEVVRQGLERHIVGATIQRVTGVHPRAVIGMTGRRFGAQVRGARFDEVGRHGKYLLLHLSNEQTIIAHLRMSGKFLVVGASRRSAPYTRTRFHLGGGRDLCFADVRTLGNMRVVPTADLSHDPSLSKLGPDALDPQFTAEHLRRRLKSARRQLKVFLLDQTHVAGVGNLYASEICFLARLSPFRRTHRLTRAETLRLHRALVGELADAIAHGGTTFDENSPNLYLDTEGSRGTHSAHLRVYQRHGQPCPACGAPIRRRVQQQRSTFWCAGCQTRGAKRGTPRG